MSKPFFSWIFVAVFVAYFLTQVVKDFVLLVFVTITWALLEYERRIRSLQKEKAALISALQEAKASRSQNPTQV